MSNEVTRWASQTPNAVAPVDNHPVGNPAAANRPQEEPHALRTLPRDITLQGRDRDVASSFARALDGAPTEILHKAFKWYVGFINQQEIDDEIVDQADQRDCRALLEKEWGASYVHNMQAVKAAYATLPPALHMVLEGGDLDDGTRALNSPAIIRWLFEQSRQPAPGGDGRSALEERAEIESLMANQRSKYWRGPDAGRLQARYRQLLGGE